MRITVSFVKFTLVGGTLLVADNIAIYYLSKLEVDRFLARSLVFFVTIIVSYFVNWLFTFKSKLSLNGFLLFVTGVGFLNLVSFAISMVLMLPFFNVTPLIALNLGAAVVYLINYFYQKSIFQ